VNLFTLGRVYIKPETKTLLKEVGITALDLIQRHVTGDWGELSEGMERGNYAAVREGREIVSLFCYSGTRFVIYTNELRDNTLITHSELKHERTQYSDRPGQGRI